MRFVTGLPTRPVSGVTQDGVDGRWSERWKRKREAVPYVGSDRTQWGTPRHGSWYSYRRGVGSTIEYSGRCTFTVVVPPTLTVDTALEVP